MIADEWICSLGVRVLGRIELEEERSAGLTPKLADTEVLKDVPAGVVAVDGDVT